MTAMTFLEPNDAARPLYLVTKERLEVWVSMLEPAARAWVEASDFRAGVGQVVLIPDGSGGIAAAAGGMGNATDAERGRFLAAKLRVNLPEGAWRFETDLDGDALQEAALGWLLAGYRFDRTTLGASLTISSSF